jgi:hypothetical protein
MKGASSTTRFLCTFSDEGCWVELRTGLVGVDPSSWVANATSAELPQAAHLVALAQDGKADPSSEGIFLPASTVASLSDAQVRALNLPEPAPFILELRAKGTLSDPAFRFETRWYRQDGRQLSIATVRGVELNTSGEHYLLLNPLFTVLQRIKEFNANPPSALDQRMQFWGELRQLMGAEAASEIKPDRYLENMRVYRATKFTLNLETKPDGSIDFDPILLADETAVRPNDADVPEDEHEPGSLLPPIANEKFSARFREHTAARPQYAVDGGIYVVFSDEARTALGVVRRLQQANPGLRKQFARNPRSFIRERFAELNEAFTVQEDSIESLFVETQQFSDRVRELGLWERPTLPWLTARTRGWLPPEFIPVVISQKEYTIQVDDLPDLTEQVGEAHAAGEPHVEYREQLIPATEEAENALNRSRDDLKAVADEWLKSEASGEDAAESRGPYSFKGGENDNFETQGYVAHLRTRDHGALDLPLLATTLKPHQEEGVAWLQQRWAAGFSGALLADDMGLGKTFQCLAFLAWLRQQMSEGKLERKPFLVVAPTGLIQNWMQEHRHHLRSPGLGRSLVAVGPVLNSYRHEGRRKDVNAGAPALRVDELREFDWILTTYETMRDYQISFALVPFAVAIFDEAQKVKNPGALVTNVAKNLNAEFFIGSTGTPVENRLADLWSITDIIQPGYLGPLRDFSRAYEDDKELHELRAARLRELRLKIEAIPNRMPPGMMVRRLKNDTLRGLPAKREHIRRALMPPGQAAAYDEAVGLGRHMKRGPKDALLALQGLRNTSLHHLPPGSVDDEEYIAQSARLASLFDVLDAVHRSNEKVLIFLESLDMQKCLAALIQRRYSLGNLPMIISGEVSGPKRQERVDRFQADPSFDAMILSPKAGGVGLTLTRANHVVHLSRWWNPAVEDQCTDRVYRIGQDKPVNVYYLLAIHPEHQDHSFDAKLNDLLERKRALSRDLLVPSAFGDADAAELYSQTISQ